MSDVRTVTTSFLLPTNEAAPAGAPAAPPSEFVIFPAGSLRTTKGDFKYSEISASKIAAHASDWNNRFMIDYNHASLNAEYARDPEEAGKAAGWFDPVGRGGALIATNIEWCAPAQQKLLAKEYRYISPTFTVDDDDQILSLINVALTNTPATKNQSPLMASDRAAIHSAEVSAVKKESVHMKAIALSLGLVESATEPEILNAVQKRSALVVQLAQLTGKPDVEGALGVITGWKAGAEKAIELSKKIEEDGKAAEKKRHVELVKEGLADGRIQLSTEKYWSEAPLSMLEGFLATAPKLTPPTGHKAMPAGEDANIVTLSAEDLHVMKSLGLKSDEEGKKEFAAAKAKQLAKRQQPAA